MFNRIWAPLLLTVAVLLRGQVGRAADTTTVAQARRVIQHESRFHPDLTYSTPEAGCVLQLDLARPAGQGPFPGVLFLHGGGWVIGSRKTYRSHLLRAAQEGYVAVAVSYRLAPKHHFPAAVHDVKAAVRWLRANACRYRVDPDHIGVVGYSAGGTLACLLGTTAGNSFFEGKSDGKQSSRVQAVVSCYGPSDLTVLYEQCQTMELPFMERTRMTLALRSYLGGTPARAGRRYAQASPVTHVSRDTAPTLLIHGTADQQVPLRQSELLEQKLRKAGIQVSLRRLKGAPHNFTGTFEEEATRALFRFLGRHLKHPCPCVRDGLESGGSPGGAPGLGGGGTPGPG